MKQLLPFAALAVITGCANSTNPSSPPSLTYEEASAFERSLLARESVMPKEPEILYTQPVNKKEACKLPTSQDQLDRPNFRAYWDGECKNGYAFGLGRDIAISDTHHYEEIIVHDGTGKNKIQPRVDYNYVDNVVVYSMGGLNYPANTSYAYKVDNPVNGVFNITHTFTEVDEHGDMLGMQYSEFSPARQFINAKNNNTMYYRFTDNSSVPVTDFRMQKFVSEVVDVSGNNNVGFAIANMQDGSIKDVRNIDGKLELVTAPIDYRYHIWGKHKEVLDFVSRVDVALIQPAQRIEREYLFKACNGKSGVKGLDKATFTKICTWRDQFKEPYAIASTNYQKQLENMKEQAASAEQQRQLQQQLAQQQQRLQQQEREQQIASFAQALDGLGKSMNNSVQPTYQYVPITQPSLSNGYKPTTTYRKVGSTVLGSDGTACQVAGSTVICR